MVSMNSSVSFHSVFDGVPVYRLKGLGSCMDGGSSWITCSMKFRTLKDCKAWISNPPAGFEWSPERARKDYLLTISSTIPVKD